MTIPKQFDPLDLLHSFKIESDGSLPDWHQRFAEAIHDRQRQIGSMQRHEITPEELLSMFEEKRQ